MKWWVLQHEHESYEPSRRRDEGHNNQDNKKQLIKFHVTCIHYVLLLHTRHNQEKIIRFYKIFTNKPFLRAYVGTIDCWQNSRYK